MSQRLLITGAFGLVGKVICRLLEDKYPEIEVTKVKCDEFSADRVLKEHYAGYDFIIHAAGYGQPQMFSKDKPKTILLNTEYTDYLIRKLKKGGSFLFISTSEVYSGAPSPHTELSIGTTTPQHPRACYIEGKRCGEAICGAYREQGYDVKIARLALAYGEGTKKGDTRVINQFIEQALTTGEIRMKDKGEAMRTYLYVEDCAQMMLNILFKGTQPVYNVGGANHEVSIAGMAQLIASMTGAKVIPGDKGLDGAPDKVEMSVGLYCTEFPDYKFTPFTEGLLKTINYQKQLYGIH